MSSKKTTGSGSSEVSSPLSVIVALSSPADSADSVPEVVSVSSGSSPSSDLANAIESPTGLLSRVSFIFLTAKNAGTVKAATAITAIPAFAKGDDINEAFAPALAAFAAPDASLGLTAALTGKGLIAGIVSSFEHSAKNLVRNGTAAAPASLSPCSFS